jgi:hypothetical protein
LGVESGELMFLSAELKARTVPPTYGHRGEIWFDESEADEMGEAVVAVLEGRSGRATVS